MSSGSPSEHDADGAAEPSAKRRRVVDGVNDGGDTAAAVATSQPPAPSALTAVDWLVAAEPTEGARDALSPAGFGQPVQPGSPLWQWVAGCVSALAPSGRLAPAGPSEQPLADAIEAVRRNGASTALPPGERGYMVTWLPHGLPTYALTTATGSLYVVTRHGGSGGGVSGAGPLPLAPGPSLDAANSAPVDGSSGDRVVVTRLLYPCVAPAAAAPPAAAGAGALSSAAAPAYAHLSLSVGFLVHDAPSSSSTASSAARPAATDASSAPPPPSPPLQLPRARLLLSDVVAYGGKPVTAKPLLKRLGMLKEWVVAGLNKSAATAHGRDAAQADAVTAEALAGAATAVRTGFHGVVFHEPHPLTPAGVGSVAAKLAPTLPHALRGLLLLPLAPTAPAAAADVQTLAVLAPGAAAIRFPAAADFNAATVRQSNARLAGELRSAGEALAVVASAAAAAAGPQAPASCAAAPATAAAPAAAAAAAGGNTLLVIVPYRDQPAQNRSEQLRRFAAGLPAFLRSPAVSPPLAGFHVLVVEQSDDGCKFNRGKLLNVGMRLAMDGPGAPAAAAARLPPVATAATSLCLHDVDLLPSAPLGRYYARPPGRVPLHLGGAWKRYPYDTYVGGVLTLSLAQAAAINGFPNNFWGWGGEDDALGARLAAVGLSPPERPGPEAADAYTDLEEVLIAERGGVRAGTSAKAGGNNAWRNLVKHEVVEADRARWRANGLADCDWAVLASRALNPDVTVVTVDLRGGRDPLASPAAQDAELRRMLDAIAAGEADGSGAARRYRDGGGARKG